MANLLTRGEIFEAEDIKYKDVPVPEWGGSVRVKGMTGQERDEFEAGMIQSGKNGVQARVDLSNVRATLCSLVICDDTGKRLFSKKDILALSKKSASALQRVFEVAQQLSGITDEDVDELVEELEENPFVDSASG